MSGSRQHTVLVVEDEPDLAELFRELLEAEGFRVLTATDGAHALAILSVSAVELVVTDLMMPVLDGFGFLRAYAQRPPPRAPVIATSAMREYLRKAIELGAAEAYDKTMVFEVLPARARALLEGEALARAPAAAPPAADELGRLQAILDLCLDQPAPGDAMRAFTEHVARVFDMPICLVSVVTHDRQYWTAFHGDLDGLADACGTAREDSFCTHSVVGRTALVVQDAAENPFFEHNRIVQEQGLRFYAGVPLSTRTGHVVGTLCVVDFKPRTFTHFDLELLGVLAKRVMAELDWREQKRRPTAPLSTFRHLTSCDEELGILGRDLFIDVLRVQACRATARSEPLAVVLVVPGAAALAPVTCALQAAFPRGQCGRLAERRLGVVALGLDAGGAEALARRVAGDGALIRAADVLPANAAEAGLEQLEESLGEAGLAALIS